MFSLTLEPNHYKFIKDLGYIPVGLGDKYFNNEFFSDKTGLNISKKNKNYGEYTFHYWIWKNYLNKLDNKWIGFCQYRKFWRSNKNENKNVTFNTIKDKILKQISSELESYESILVEQMYVNNWKTMKFIKKGLKTTFTF